MSRIEQHPIIDTSPNDYVEFIFDGHTIKAEKGFTIASALHRAGFPVHSHSLKNRNRSLDCGIGKCGACEMLVDGEVKRICISKVDGVKEISEISLTHVPEITAYNFTEPVKVYKCDVAIIGAGPAGLAAREILTSAGVNNLVIDSGDQVGGQFLMQTHQFFFFENERKFGGERGFDITNKLAGDNCDGIILNSTVWDILDGKRLAIKNIKTSEIFYIDADYLIVATGAVPFMPTFGNDDLPGVYTAAVIQKMMNIELTLLGKNVLTVGAGNIGYLTSYQLLQAGANVKAIVEALPNAGGFPVQENRIRRLGVPIILSHMLVKAIPNSERNGISGAVIAECENYKPILGTEQVIRGIDAINICTGLTPDNLLLTQGYEVFGRNCYGAGDTVKIGEGTSALLQGKEAAFKVLQAMKMGFDYDGSLVVSKEYIDSRQHPKRVLDKPCVPTAERAANKPFVIIDCLYGFACNPCAFACPFGAITKSSTSSVPRIDFDKCIGCMQCINHCPGLAIFGYNLSEKTVFLPIEFEVNENDRVWLVDNDGTKIDTGTIVEVKLKPNKTNVVKVIADTIDADELMQVRGFIELENYPLPVELDSYKNVKPKSFICHCSDVNLAEILAMVAERKFISVDEIKHTTRLGMGPCRGKRCLRRLQNALRSNGIDLIGEATPRGPLSNQIGLGELYPHVRPEIIVPAIGSRVKTVQVKYLIAGGGIAGSSVYRYLAEAGEKPTLINSGHGSSWRNIAGGRSSFSIRELADIARENKTIFEDLQSRRNIDYRNINYVTFAHDDEMYRSLEASRAWSDAEFIKPQDFQKHISPYMNPDLNKYQAALMTRDCWQASPGKVIDLIRNIGCDFGGKLIENCELVDIHRDGNLYRCLARNKMTGDYCQFIAEHFVNALGEEAAKFAEKLNIYSGLYPVRHQAFITRRLPMLGHDKLPLPMIIDRQKREGFSAVYGQQLAETGQIIGCASPAVEDLETGRDVKLNTQKFIEIISKTFCDWLPALSSVGYQAIWSGYYVEPRMIVDPKLGLFVGLRGQGFMLGQYLGKLYVDSLLSGKISPYLERLALDGDGLQEGTFK